MGAGGGALHPGELRAALGAGREEPAERRGPQRSGCARVRSAASPRRERRGAERAALRCFPSSFIIVVIVIFPACLFV